MDRILIQDLHVWCLIGVNEEERHRKQDIIINLELSTDLSRPGKSDRLEDAVDYRAIKKAIMAFAESSQFFLIEALAEAIAGLCLRNQAVTTVTVRVEKPGALSSARSVAVEIERRRKA